MPEVRAYHNIARDNNGRPLGMIYGFSPEHSVVKVFRTRIPCRLGVTRAVSDVWLAEEVFRLLNVGHDPEFGTPDQHAIQYRERGNRSLSVGDLVEVGGRFYAVGRFGWQAVEQPANIVRKNVHGTAFLLPNGNGKNHN